MSDRRRRASPSASGVSSLICGIALTALLGTLPDGRTAQAASDFDRSFVEKLGSAPLEGLANGTRVIDMSSTSEVADDLRVYGIVGVAFVRARDDAEAGTLLIAYYVFDQNEQAQAFPGKYLDELRAQAGGWVAEFPLLVKEPEQPDLDGRCIATKAVGQGFCFFVERDQPVVIHIAAEKPAVAPDTSTRQIAAIVQRRMNRAVADVITAARAHVVDAAMQTGD